MPAWPAYLLLFASIPLLIPTLARRLGGRVQPSASGTIAVRWIVVAVALSVAVPAAAIAASTPMELPTPAVFQGVPGDPATDIFAPVDDSVGLRVEREGDRRQLGSGICVGDRSADRSPVADLEVPDHRNGLGEQRDGGGLGGAFDDPLRRHRLDREAAVLPLDAAELADAVQVDDVREAGETQREHRHEALPAGQRFRVVAVLGVPVLDT